MKITLKTLLFIALSSILTASCSTKVDQTDLQSVGKEIYQAFLDNDTSRVRPFTLKSSKLTNSFLQTKDYKHYYPYELSSPKLLKIDTSFNEPDAYINPPAYMYSGWYNPERIVQIYLKSGDDYLEISASGKRDSLRRFWVNFLYVRSITEDCQKERDEPYRPNGVTLKEFRYWPNYYDKSIIDKATVKLENHSGSDIDYLKYSVAISPRGKSDRLYYGTNETYVKLYAANVIEIEIPSLRHFRLNYPIDRTYWEGFALEATPKQYYDCIILKELQDLQ